MWKYEYQKVSTVLKFKIISHERSTNIHYDKSYKMLRIKKKSQSTCDETSQEFQATSEYSRRCWKIASIVLKDENK